MTPPNVGRFYRQTSYQKPCRHDSITRTFGLSKELGEGGERGRLVKPDVDRGVRNDGERRSISMAVVITIEEIYRPRSLEYGVVDVDGDDGSKSKGGGLYGAA